MNHTIIILLAGVVALGLAMVVFRVIARRHSTACPVWAAVFLDHPYFRRVAGSDRLLDRAGVTEGMTVLDVGCGPGRVAIPAAERVGPGGRVVALDLQPGMIHELQLRIAPRGLTNVETVVAGAGTGEVQKGVFDRVLLVTVLGEIVDQGAALREMYAALKPNGLLSITEVIPDPHYQSRRRVQRLAEAAGFRFAESFGRWYAFTMNFERRR